ncbi:MAG: ribbon-helix-helix domain-containing protein [Chloroflexota bacterium]|nr:ribbon-helix-helix domain-containing protein [Chloroflexota bacterium]
MNLTNYVNELQQHLAVAAEAGGEQARALADRLIAPLEAATRLILLEALAAAAGEITSQLAPGSVDVRLRGRDPEFVVTAPPAGPAFGEVAENRSDAGPPSSQTSPGGIDEGGEGGMSRTTLRLPEHLKLRVEEAAIREGLSVNSWLVRAIAAALEPKDPRPAPHAQLPGDRYTGWVR